MKTIKILFAIGMFLFNIQSFAQENDEKLQVRVDSLFSQWNNNYSPGCALGIIKEGKLIYKKGYGLSNLEYDIPITPASIFHMASVSKQFTAFSIVLLAQEGKLSLDHDIRKYLPEVPDFGKTITINHLIHHTSGLRDQWELLVMAGWRLDDVITKDHILKMVSYQKELNFNPGDEQFYCNTGYTLLAEIVSRVSGMPFTRFTKERIFDPLGMKDTHFHDDHQEIVKNRTYSYNYLGNKHFSNAVLSYANAGATSLFSTVEDLAKWLNNFGNPIVGGENAIKQMYEKGKLNNGKTIDYAFGLSIYNYKGLKIIDHGGADAGYRTYLCRFPDNDFSVIVLSNLGSVNTGDLAHRVADIYLNDKLVKTPAVEKTIRKEISIDPSQFEKYTGTYQLAPGFLIKVVVENNNLYAEATGQGKAQIFAESETQFFAKIVDAQLSFENQENGKYTKLVLHQNGQNLPAPRIEVKEVNPSDFKEYEGNYYSEELGTSYVVKFGKKGLIVTHRRNDNVSLQFVKKDSFTGNQWWFSKIEFDRDSSNKVTGFHLTGSRVRNLKFVKTS